MDLELLGYGDPAPEQLSRVVREICAVELEDDGLAFDRESLDPVKLAAGAVPGVAD